MKAVCKKLFSLMLVAILLVSAVPFQALAAEANETTEAAIAEVAATEPAAQAGVVLDPNQYMYIDFQLGTIVDDASLDLGNLLVSRSSKTKVTGKVSTPSASSALKTLALALSKSEGYEFVRWYLEDGTTFSSDNYITQAMYDSSSSTNDKDDLPIVDVFAEFRKATKTIKLNANGGKVSTNKHNVHLGGTYGEITNLPVPTKANCEFLGWYKEDNTKVEDGDTVIDLSSLTAKWSSAVYTVQYQAFPADGSSADDWTDVFAVSVMADTVLAVADGKFPSADDISEDFALEGWKIEGWEAVQNGASITGDKTKVADAMAKNGVITIRPIYKKAITLYSNNGGGSKRTLTVTLGKAIPSLPTPGEYDGHAFHSWCTAEGDVQIMKAKLSDISSHPAYYPHMGDLWAHWVKANTVLLNIYTNGNMKTPTLSKYYEAASEIDFDLTEINMYSVFPSYGNYDDEGDEQYGWYTQDQWYNYVIGKTATEIEIVEEGKAGTWDDEDNVDYREFYIMLVNNANDANANASTGNNYNTNSSTADKTNPATGDQIFMAVTVLAVSACALALIFFYKKRQAK